MRDTEKLKKIGATRPKKEVSVMEQMEQAVLERAEVVDASEGLGLFDQIVADSKVASTDSEKASARDQIGELVDEALAGTVTVSMDLAASIDLRIAQLDQLLSDQLNAIMHQPEFQKLEASWRGLKYLVMQSETSPMLKVKMLNASKKDLVRDFKTAPELTKPHSSRRSTKRNTAPSAVPRTAA